MKSKVYFVPLSGESTGQERLKAVKTLCKLPEIDAIIEKKDMVAVKIHVGEIKNTTYIKPDLVKPIIEKIKRSGGLPFLTETSTLYKGERSNAVDHFQCAYAHGYTPQNVGATFIMADGLRGNTEIEVDIEGKIMNKVSIAREVVMADALMILTHATGHLAMGFGGALKNMGMGLASRKGKLRQHSSIKPYINVNACTFCKKCIQWCPEDAIVPVKDHKEYVSINKDKCIGCGECLTVCNFSAVLYNWETESVDLQRNMVEHVMGIMKGKEKKSFFITFLTDMTMDCDCIDKKQDILIPDIGLCASIDPVALDQATLDLTKQKNGKHIGSLSYPHYDPYIQVEHAAALGLGNREYDLEEIG